MRPGWAFVIGILVGFLLAYVVGTILAAKAIVKYAEPGYSTQD